MAQGSGSCCQHPSAGTAQQAAATRGCTKAFGHPPLDPFPSRMDWLHCQEEEPGGCRTARTDTLGQTHGEGAAAPNPHSQHLKGSAQSCSSCQPLFASAKAPQLPLSLLRKEGTSLYILQALSTPPSLSFPSFLPCWGCLNKPN